MKKMFLLFSHTLTDIQIEDAVKSFSIEKFVSLPNDLQVLWSNIPPEIDDLSSYLEPLKHYFLMEASLGDYMLIQGDFGGGYTMVNFAREQGFIPLYATTKRDVIEKTVEEKVVKTSVFEHVKFREYR